jgi:diguanylate cyclase (GGDEF)-like protein
MTMRTRLLFYFGLIGASAFIAVIVLWLYGLPGLGIEGIYSREYQRSIASVEALANKEQSSFENWFDEHRRELNLLSANELFASAVGALTAQDVQGSSNSRLQLERQLRKIKDTSLGAYDYLYVMDPHTKRLLASSDPQWTQSPQDQRIFLNLAMESGLAESIHLVNDAVGNGLLIINQIDSRDAEGLPTGKIKGVLVARLSLGAPLRDDASSIKQILGLSGDVILIDHDDQLLFRSSQTNDAEDIAFVTKNAVSGTEGVKLLKAPSGAEFIAAFRHLHLGASEELSLAVIRDTTEALTTVRWTFIRLAGVSFVGFVLIFFLVLFAARRIGIAENEIKRLAYYDPLTKLPNRRLLLDRIDRALVSSARTKRTCAILFLDLDNFKAINDTLGHIMGDMMLRQAAQRLVGCVREGDTVARLGGDEFVVMLEDLSAQLIDAAEQAEAVGEKVLIALEQVYKLDNQDIRSSASIGATVFVGGGLNSEELLKQADIAMYQAKKSGRNNIHFFDPKMQEAINHRVQLERELHKGLEVGQFQLHYQVQVDNNRRTVGAEALIRWMHPEKGMVSPAQFIPLAEETGLIVAIGNWVLDCACAQISAWAKDEVTLGLTLAVNVSAKQFRQTDFVSQIQAAIRRHGISPRLLKLELTESLLLDDIGGTVATMNALKEIGVQFSLDDFGTGYSSLQYLKQLPLNQIKIDQSFVRDIASDQNDAAIVQTIIAMAETMGFEVIAEGVETEAQLVFLDLRGCHAYQGYLFGKPMPIEQFEASIRRA